MASGASSNDFENTGCRLKRIELWKIKKLKGIELWKIKKLKFL